MTALEALTALVRLLCAGILLAILAAGASALWRAHQRGLRRVRLAQHDPYRTAVTSPTAARRLPGTCCVAGWHAHPAPCPNGHDA